MVQGVVFPLGITGTYMATLFGWSDFLFCFSVSRQKLNNCFSTFYYFLICFLGLFCFGQFKIQQSNSKCKITQVFQKPWRIDPSNLIFGLITFVKVFKAMSCCHSLEQILRPVSKCILKTNGYKDVPGAIATNMFYVVDAELDLLVLAPTPQKK